MTPPSLNKDLVNAKKIFRDQLYDSDGIKTALARYINSLNLQSQVNANILTEKQAAVLFVRAIEKFERDLHVNIDRGFQKNQFDQTDLSNPQHMQNALNTPGSTANLEMNAIEAIMVDALNENAIANEKMLQTQLESTDSNTLSPTPKPSKTSDEDDELKKGGAITTALKAKEDEKDLEKVNKLLGDALEKNTGLVADVSTALKDGLEGTAKNTLEKMFEAPTPKPPSSVE
jgi:hypothetical protein